MMDGRGRKGRLHTCVHRIQVPQLNHNPITNRMLSTISTPQWYLGSDGANVVAAWERGYTGKGITIFFMDDGLDYNHDDFAGKHLQKASWGDPMPGTCKSTSETSADTHGMVCAGIALAASNDKCGVGVAFDANVAAANIYRDSNFPNLQMQFGSCNVTGNAHHISSNSWGIDACSDINGRRRLASGTCPFLPAEVNPTTPCADSSCSSSSWNGEDYDSGTTSPQGVWLRRFAPLLC